MSSVVEDWECTQCKEGKGFQEHFKDSEEGHILECRKCKYMEVYREDVETGDIIEDYQGINITTTTKRIKMFDDIKKEIDDTLNHMNPFENICSDGYSGNNILPSHVKKFIADKKATQKEQELVDNYIDEIKLNKGEK